jgi:hypothetical protein
VYLTTTSIHFSDQQQQLTGTSLLIMHQLIDKRKTFDMIAIFLKTMDAWNDRSIELWNKVVLVYLFLIVVIFIDKR